MAGNDYYQILGVKRDASQKEIRQAYRRLARRHHPDVNPGDKAAEARFKEINEAHEVLADAEKRRKYDKYGEQWQYADQIEEARRRAGGRGFASGPSGTFDFDLGDLGGIGGDLGGIFGNLFRGARRGPARRRGADMQYAVEVTLEEAYRGTARTIQLSAEEPCPTCGGSGRIAGAICHVCEGSSTTLRARRLEVKIPPGVRNGSKVRVAGEGGAGVGGSRGDLYLVVSVRPHPRFERDGDDLRTQVEVPLTDAVLGGEVEVSTLDAKVMLKVPALTPNGKVFRLASKGMPQLNGSGRGNLYAKVNVRLPEKLSEKERKLFEELRAASS